MTRWESNQFHKEKVPPERKWLWTEYVVVALLAAMTIYIFVWGILSPYLG